MCNKLSTVHWGEQMHGRMSLMSLARPTHGVSEKKRFTPNQIELALDVLAAKRWIPASFRSESSAKRFRFAEQAA